VLCQSFLVNDASIKQMDGAIRVLRVSRIVSHHADRCPFAIQFAQQIHDGFAVAGVQIAGGLVREQNRWSASKRPSHSHSLLLTAGKLRWVMLHAMRHADLLQRLLDALLPLARRHTAVRQRQLNIFVNGQIADQVERLENETDFPVAREPFAKR
jgi:hypothetical protein